MNRSLWIYKAKAFVFFTVAYCFFYLFPNFYPLSSPYFLHLTIVDRAMPFLPWSFVVYLSDYVLVCSVAVWLTERKKFDAFVRMVFCGLVICGSVFLIFPTTYPRPIYPEDGFWLFRFLMGLVASWDTPNNCFPSMHVVMTGVAAWALRGQGKMKFLIYLVWSGAIFVSTLTTKQHYLWDVIGGGLVIGITAFLEAKVFSQYFESFSLKQ